LGGGWCAHRGIPPSGMTRPRSSTIAPKALPCVGRAEATASASTWRSLDGRMGETGPSSPERALTPTGTRPVPCRLMSRTDDLMAALQQHLRGTAFAFMRTPKGFDIALDLA